MSKPLFLTLGAEAPSKGWCLSLLAGESSSHAGNPPPFLEDGSLGKPRFFKRMRPPKAVRRIVSAPARAIAKAVPKIIKAAPKAASKGGLFGLTMKKGPSIFARASKGLSSLVKKSGLNTKGLAKTLGTASAVFAGGFAAAALSKGLGGKYGSFVDKMFKAKHGLGPQPDEAYIRDDSSQTLLHATPQGGQMMVEQYQASQVPPAAWNALPPNEPLFAQREEGSSLPPRVAGSSGMIPGGGEMAPYYAGDEPLLPRREIISQPTAQQEASWNPGSTDPEEVSRRRTPFQDSLEDTRARVDSASLTELMAADPAPDGPLVEERPRADLEPEDLGEIPLQEILATARAQWPYGAYSAQQEVPDSIFSPQKVQMPFIMPFLAPGAKP